MIGRVISNNMSKMQSVAKLGNLTNPHWISAKEINFTSTCVAHASAATGPLT